MVRVLERKTTLERKPNRLINEKSTYLLQHAYNPVDWYPWGQEAFERAKAEDKPVFVSIGYSSCHWCHVMEKECFEDSQVAMLMNLAFICVKVDREERPDVDALYMAVCQAMGRSCGWPLNVLLTPDRKPFFAASYIPKNSRFGMTGMVELIPQIMEIWRLRRVDIEQTGDAVKNRIESAETRLLAGEISKDVLDDAYEKLVMDFDDQNGGFGDAPKFPRPHTLLFLLRYWKRNGEKNALAIVEKTLQHMRFGGIFDQVGFGFHRYSTDAFWLVPHFEKMLYDQALLALAYIEAYQATGENRFKETAQETLDYVLRDLESPKGGFFSAEDADSEGEEGKFYLWTRQEIKDTVEPEDTDLAVRLFGVEAQGNYYEPSIRDRTGKNILHFPKSIEEIATELGLTNDELIFRLGRIRNALFQARKNRIRPTKDDKILTDWNGLIIAALARAAQIFNDQKYLKAAGKAAEFLFTQMLTEEGILYHRFAKGERAVEGLLDDYAFFTFGLFELYEATFNEKYLQHAVELTNTMIERFWDNDNGGFYFTKYQPEEVLPRLKQAYDGAVPSGNSVALMNLLRLARLINNPKFDEIAAKLMHVFTDEVSRSPVAYTFLLSGFDFAFGPAHSVTLVGNITEEGTQKFLATLHRNYLPNVVVSLKPSDSADKGYRKVENKTTAYVCQGQMCLPPTNDPDKMLEQLRM